MDIQNITSDLIATGLTQQELADLVPCSQSAINAFLKGNRGSRPSLAIGKRLLDLHAERCPVVPPQTRRAGDPMPEEESHPPRILPSPKNLMGFGVDQPANFESAK